MTIAIISDTHIGDGSSRLVDVNSGLFSPNLPAYQNLKKGIQQFTKGYPLQYFVLAGDIMDFSINSIDNSITIARSFFAQISNDRLADHVIYIPGNHDKQVWDGVQWDTSIIGNLSGYCNPKPFARIQPACIDAQGLLLLYGIKPNAQGKFGDIFLKGLFGGSSNDPTIILAYPNLYIVRNNETIIVTHGHMFETAWVLLSDLLQGVSGLPNRNSIGLRELEEWNIPITSMICTGVGSGGDVSKLFYQIELEAYKKKFGTLSKTLDEVLPRVEDALEIRRFIKRLIPDWLIKKLIIHFASQAEDPRSYANYLNDEKKAEHFDMFFQATAKELKRLNLPNSNKIIFGHTHHPYSSKTPYQTLKFPGLTFYNTGGWLKGSNAEVFLIDTQRLTSFTV